MKTHTSSFKEQIKLMGKEIDSRITFGSTVLGKDDLNAVTPSYQGAILKSAMKQLDIDSNVEIPIGTILKYEFGLKVNGEYEYINYGNYVVYSVEKQEDTNSYKITCYDKLLYSMLDYVKLPITYPISIRDYINSISTALGLKFANKSETFANYDKQIQADLYDGLGYTFRDILDELAQVTASTICLNNNDELEIRYITETGDTIDEEFLKDVNVNFGEKFGAINTIVLSRSGDSDSVYYPPVLPANPYEIKISDNQIMNGNDRADFLPDIYDKLNGLEFYTNDFVSTGIIYYDLCDRYSVKVGDNTYSCVMFNNEVLVTQGLEENVYTELPEQTETDYKHASKDDRMINQVYIIAKKNEAEILALVSTTETIQKEINPTKDESGSEIIIEDASNNPLTYLEIEGKSTQETRSGKNRFDKDNLNIINTYISSSGVVGSATTSTDKIWYIKCKPNTTYTISRGNITGSRFNIGTYPTTDVMGVSLNQFASRFNYSFATITTNSNTEYLFVNLIDGSITDEQKILDSLQIEEGSTVTEYEPYGVSPSPDYPSEIESVGYENLAKNNIVSNLMDYANYITATSTGEAKLWWENIIGLPRDVEIIGNWDFESDGIVIENISGVRVYIGYSDGTYLLAIKGNPFIIPSDKTISEVRVYGNQQITYSKWENIIFTKGTKVHPYIPYGKSGVEVKTIGKNLLNVPNTLTITGYKLFNVNFVKGVYTLSIGNIATDYTGKLLLAFGYEDNTALYININKETTSTKIELTKNVNKLYIYSGLNANESLNVTTTYTNIMLEKGSVATDYEPYQEPRTSLIVLDEPLRSLPNGVKDIAYIKNNKLYVDRYVGSLILDGSENWTKFSTGSNNKSVFNGTGIGASNAGTAYADEDTAISNYFKQSYVDNSYGDVGRFMLWSAGNGAMRVVFNDDDTTTLEDFKTWLSTHNTQVDYELATPVTEELGEIEMLKTLKGYNDILTTDELLPIINLTYVRDTILADYVENHVAELKLTEKEIKTSVETVSSSVDGLNTSINRVEEITNDNSQVINIISTNIDKTTGEVREVTTATGFTFNADGMTIDDGSGFKAQHRANGTYYKDGETIVGQYTKDGSKQKDLELFGTYSYGKESIDDTPMFVGQLYRDENGEECFGHFYNGGDY